MQATINTSTNTTPLADQCYMQQSPRDPAPAPTLHMRCDYLRPNSKESLGVHGSAECACLHHNIHCAKYIKAPSGI